MPVETGAGEPLLRLGAVLLRGKAGCFVMAERSGAGREHGDERKESAGATESSAAAAERSAAAMESRRIARSDLAPKRAQCACANQGMVMTMPDDAPIIRFPSEEEQQAALDKFTREIRRVKERKESVPPEKLNEALEMIADYLKTGWSTGGGRRLRQFVWSLWNGHHLINLYDLSSGLDGRLTEAVIVVFNAAMVDALSEKQKRCVLKVSGELARWEQARAETPEDEEVLYPPFPMSTEALRRAAHSAEQSDRRIEQQRRAEQAREVSDE